MFIDQPAPLQPKALSSLSSNDSKNALTDFDMCLALTQRAINSQLVDAWDRWTKKKLIKDTLVLPEFRKNKKGEEVPAKYGINIQLGPISIKFNVPNGKLGQVNVTINIPSGVVKYLDEDDGDSTYEIVDWSITVTVDLDKKPVDLKALADIDPESGKIAKETIAQSGYPDSVFSIEYLFLRFTDVDLFLSDAKHIEIPKTMPVAARSKALESLGILFNKEIGEFLLGTVVRRNRDISSPTFAMTDFMFHVDANQQLADASTLSYLGMFSQRTLPADRNAARLKITEDWINPSQIDGSTSLIAGIMVIRKEIFMDQYLIPLFTKQFGFAPSVSGYTRTFSTGQAGTDNLGEIGVQHLLDRNDQYSFSITPILGTNKINLSASIVSARTYRERTLRTLVHREGLPTLEASGKGTRSLTGVLTLTAQGIGATFTVHPQMEHQFSPVQIEGDTQGFAKVTKAFNNLFGIPDMQTMLSNTTQQKVNDLSQILQNVLSQINIDLGQHQFIPPGGGVFTFQNLHFSDKTGDVIFDVIYRAP